MTSNASSYSLGQRIKIERQNLQITQGELAKRLRVTPQHISAIELDKRLPSLAFLVELAQQLNVTTDYIITGKYPNAPDTIAAIRADDKLPPEARKVLVLLVELLHRG